MDASASLGSQNFTIAPTMQMMARIAGAQAASVGPVNNAFQSTQLNLMRIGLYRGRMCWRMINTNGAAPMVWCNYRASVRQFQKPPFNITSDTNFVWRFVVVVAAGPCAANAGFDQGFLFMTAPGQGNGIFSGGGGVSGFGVYWGPDGRVHWVSHRTLANNFPNEDLVIAPADQDWHSIEIRITGATQQADAQLAVVYDGISVVARNWGPGTVLPDFTSDGSLVTLSNQFGNGPLGNPSFLYLSEYRVMSGPTLSSLF
jgi:hypothetical protein